MAIENEIIGEINRDIFENKKNEFTKKYGSPQIKKRLGLMVLNKLNANVDTRIRITNGCVEVMQKVTQLEDNKGHFHKLEISYKINSNVDDIYNAFITYSNMVKYIEKNNIIRLLVQTENYTWNINNFEVKLSYQFGKSDYYTFEIEALKENQDLRSFQKKINLIEILNHSSPERKEFRITKVDLNADEMSEIEIKEIIKRYLNKI